jgi:hypothetical protein
MFCSKIREERDFYRQKYRTLADRFDELQHRYRAERCGGRLFELVLKSGETVVIRADDHRIDNKDRPVFYNYGNRMFGSMRVVYRTTEPWLRIQRVCLDDDTDDTGSV